MDYEVSRKVWDAQIPVQFTLQAGGPLGDPLPYYTMLPRFTYLALALPKALSSFNRRETNGGTVTADKVHLEINGAPVKMYLPIGVIYDQMAYPEPDAIMEIHVRTSPQPPPADFQMVTVDMMQAMFFQTVKEADYLRTKAEVTKGFMKDDMQQLWRSLMNTNFDEYWGVIQKLADPGKDFLHVPLRVYVKNQPFKQALVTIKHPDGSLRTIGDAVSEILQLSPGPTSSSEASTPTSESSTSSESPAEDPSARRLISHGIDIPAHTPLVFAAKNVAYPDNFVHIVVIASSSCSKNN